MIGEVGSGSSAELVGCWAKGQCGQLQIQHLKVLCYASFFDRDLVWIIWHVADRLTTLLQNAGSSQWMISFIGEKCIQINQNYDKNSQNAIVCASANVAAA